MAAQLPNIMFTGFKSVNEITQPEKLSPEELTILNNMRLDEPAGVPTTRKGFSYYNEQVDAVAGANINSIFDVQDQNENDFLLVAIGTKLRKSANGSAAYVDLKTGLTNNATMRMSPYGGKFLFTNGADSPFYADSNNGWAVNNMALPTPDVTGVAVSWSDTGGTSIGIGLFKYILIYITADGQTGNASIPMQNQLDSITENVESVTFASLPVSSDSRVTGRLLFRTKQYEFDQYYLLTTLDNSQTSYTDITPDAQLNTSVSFPNPGSNNYMNTPNSAQFICANNNRTFLANIVKQYLNRVLPPTFSTYNSSYYTLAGSGQLTGNYKWALSYVDNSGNESQLVPYIAATGLSYNSITFNAFPLPFVSWVKNSDGTYTFTLDSTIKSVRFYRTKNGGSIYYFVGDFNPSTVTYGNYPLGFTDNTSDFGLSAAYPLSGHGSNETAIIAYAIVWSDIDTYLDFEETNYDEVYPDDGDPITGIFNDDNSLVIFKQKSICRFYANGDPSTWYSQKIVENVGCDSPNSIYKLGHSYFFVYLNKCYVFDGESAQEISYTRKTTFDSVTAFLGGTYWNDSEWYVLSVQIGTAYYLLCYDTKLKAWYKFSIFKADTIATKEFGQDAGKLLFGGNLYVTTYNESQAYDSDSGSNISINIELQTKDYSFNDNFIRARLMFMFINYYRLHGTTNNSIVFALTDPNTNLSITYTDVYDVDDQLIWRIATDGMQGRLERVNKINFNISGQALSQFFAGRLDYNIEKWGNTFKQPYIPLENIVEDDNSLVVTDDNSQVVTDDI